MTLPRILPRLGQNALLALLAGAAGPAGAQVPVLQAPPPEPPLSLFQWAVMAGGALLLVEIDGALYPAELDGEGLIETHPVQVEIRRFGAEVAERAPLRAIRAPQEITPEGWVMETRDGEGWRAVDWRFFADMAFFVRRGPQDFAAVELADIRFVPRD